MGFEQVKKHRTETDIIEEYDHDSGGTFVRMRNNDPNAAFAVGFKTAPETDKGMPHIVEHSVLSGSRNYPVDELFAKAKKSSICHFINALTYNDRTIYPVASHNDHELKKLTDIYLDSVFNPLLLDDPGIFRKEGWRIETTDDGPEYQGVVLSEMKNSAYKPRRLLDYETGRALTPDTCYAHSSGGIPTDIVDLSYDELMDFYDRHYGAKNSFTFLYGDIDNEEQIMHCIDRHLTEAHPGESITIEPQQTPGTDDRTARYAASADQADNDLQQWRRTGLETQTKAGYVRRGAGLILQKLLSKHDGPFETTLRSADFAERIQPRYSIETLQPTLRFTARQLPAERLDDLRQAVDQAVQVALDEGWDDQTIEAYIQDFKREQKQSASSTRRGFIKAQNVARNWAFDLDIPKSMDNERGFEAIEQQYDDPTFRSMLEALTGTDRTVEVALSPDPDRIEAINSDLEVKLQQSAATDNTRTERPGSVEPPSKQALLDNRPEQMIETVGSQPETFFAMAPELSTIHYYYNLNDCSDRQLRNLSAALDYQGVAGTEHYSHSEYQQALKAAGGRIAFQLIGRTDYNAPTTHTYLRSTIQSVPGNERTVLDLYSELESGMTFNDREALTARIEKNLRLLQQAVLTGDQVSEEVKRRVVRHYRQGGYRHATLPRLKQNDDLSHNLEKRMEVVEDATTLLAPERIDYTAVAAPPEQKDSVLNAASGRSMGRSSYPGPLTVELPEKDHATFYNKQSVAHVGIGVNFDHTDDEYRGAMNVIKAALDDYLWEAIRVKQGNYNVQSKVGRSGTFGIVARQGTDPEANLQAMREAQQFLIGLDPDGKELRRLKASALNSFEPPRSATGHLRHEVTKRIIGMDEQDVLNERSDLLGAGVEQLREGAELIESLFEHGTIIKQGNPDLIKEPVGAARNVDELM